MRKYFIVLIILSLSLVALGYSDKENLELKLQKNLSAIIRITSKLETVYKSDHAGKKDFTVYDETVNEYFLECLKVDSDGNMTIKQTWKSSKETSTDIEGKKFVRFDSSDKTYPIPESNIIPFNLVGESMLYVVSPKGKILEVNGYEKLVNKLAEPAKKYLHLNKKGIVEMLKKRKLHGVSEFCSQGPMKIGKLYEDKAPSKEKTFPKTVKFSKKLILKKTIDNLAFYETIIEQIRDEKKDTVDFGGKTTTHTYKKKFQNLQDKCDIETGLIISRVHKLNNYSKNVYLDYDESKIIKENFTKGIIRMELKIKKP